MNQGRAVSVCFDCFVYVGSENVFCKKTELFRSENMRGIRRFYKKRRGASFFDFSQKRAGGFPKAQHAQIYRPACGLARVQLCLFQIQQDMAQGAGDAGVGELARLQKIREFLCGRELKAAVSHPRRQIFPHILESCQSFPWQ